MSKVKVQQPIVHTPSFKQYYLSGATFQLLVEKIGLTLPMGRLDANYYFTDMPGWSKILFDLVFKSSLYKTDRFDCENYAMKAMNLCAERYGINTLGVAIGNVPERHAFNFFYHGNGFLLWEPNSGFEWSGQPFEIGENGYNPEIGLV